ncbi:hypothetical protein [Haladaptatus sp. DFWS20]|uniref:hypothetical protein n=1 Tax=Haladaptatus sp. DFWS20 TaxID=3403467 RepID=UPI003EBAA891
MVYLDQPLFMLGHGVEDPADGIHGELVPVSDDERTDCAIEHLGCDTRVARTRVESVRYPYPFRED